MRSLSLCVQHFIVKGENISERPYIREEVRCLVRKNRDIRSPEEIAAKVTELETRIETAVHYQIPYPRPVNVMPGATGKNPRVVTPVYLHSYKTSIQRNARGSPRSEAPVYDK